MISSIWMLIGPLILGAGGILVAFITNMSKNKQLAQKDADHAKEIADAKVAQTTAEKNLELRKTAEAQASADAAQTTVDAVKERSDAENAQSGLSDDAARARLRDLAASINPAANNQGSAGTDKDR